MYAKEDAVVPKIATPSTPLSASTGDSKMALMLRDEANWSLALMCEDLASSRDSWRGLDPCLGQTEVGRIEPGKTGVPMDYSDLPPPTSGD